MAIHDGHRQRLKDTYKESGPSAMREHQLLELLLTYAIPRKDVNPIAHELINRYGTLDEVLKADITELSKIDGIGENAAILISVCGAMRNIREKPKKRPRLGTPQASCKYCIELLRTQRYETTMLSRLTAACGLCMGCGIHGHHRPEHDIPKACSGVRLETWRGQRYTVPQSPFRQPRRIAGGRKCHKGGLRGACKHRN